MSAAHDTQFGVVERRGIELVPESERHGRPRDLFFVWVAANANVFSIVNGALLISLGLNFLQSVAVQVGDKHGIASGFKDTAVLLFPLAQLLLGQFAIRDIRI